MSMAKNLMQGDQHAIPFVLKMKDGTLITDAMVKTVVLNLGNLSRQYPGDVTYKNGQWLFPVTQAQTFAMRGSVEPQARVEFLNDDIFGGAGEPVELQNALNKGIIGTDGTTAAKQNAPTMQTELQGAILVIVAAAGVEFSAEGAVRYDKTQSLTDAQKQQARDNIGVVDVPTPSAENVGKIPVSKQVGDGYKYVMEDKSTSDLSLGLTGTTVGQVPAVKTIDEQGKPTEWEATTLPNEAFIVYFTLKRKLTGDPIITSDRTPEEVINAIESKKLVIALVDENHVITQLCNIANNPSHLYFFTISEDGSTFGIGWNVDIDTSGERTYTLTTVSPGNFIQYNGISGSNQIFGTGDTGGYEFKQHIGFENLPDVTTSDNGKFMRVVSGAWAAAEGDASFDITGASTGQSPIINAVDADGKPTAWGAALLAKVDGSNIPTSTMDAFRTRIAVLPGVKIYGKADANGKIKAYTDAACTEEATITTTFGLIDYGNALLIYDRKTYQCVGFEEPASMQGSGNYVVTVFFRSEIVTDSAGTAVLKVETAKLNIVDYLSGAINAPITITAGELPLTATTTT
jgi:hypothetical protein